MGILLVAHEDEERMPEKRTEATRNPTAGECETLKQRQAELEARLRDTEAENAQLRAREAHYRTIADTSRDWIYWLAPDLRFLYVSPACEAATGYPPQAFLDDPGLFWRIIHPHDQAVMRDHVAGLPENVEHAPIEFRITHALGEVRWMAHTCRPVFGERGDFQGRRGSNRDISLRKAMEKALLASEARYKSMFDGITSCVAVYRASEDGLDFFFEDFNRAAEQYSNLPRNVVRGRNVQEVFPGVAEMGLLDVLRRVYATGMPESHPVSRYSDQRITLWVENYVYKLPTGEVVALYNDLTAEKLAEASLRVQTERLNMALEATSDALWDWDIATGGAYFSPRYFTMLGYEPGELAQNLETWEALVHPDDLEPAKRHIAEHIEQGKPYHTEFRLRAKSGQWQWVLGRGKIMERDEHGRPKRMVGTHVDIHDLKTMQARLQSSLRELEALNTLSRSVALGISLEGVIEAAIEWVMRVISPNLAVLYLLEDGAMVIRGARAEGLEFNRADFDLRHEGECLCGLAALGADMQFSPNLFKDDRCTRSECKDAGLRSFTALPLLSRGQTIGVLGLGSREERDFAERSSFLQSTAALISTGIANAQLHRHVQAHADELEDLVDKCTAELKKLLNAVEHSPASIVITDTRGDIEYVNPFFTRITGFTRKEALGNNPRILKSGLHDTAFYEAMWRTLLARQTWRGEICNRKKDGSLYWEDASISPLLNEAGEVVSYVAVKEDITEKKQAEDVLQESERRYKTIFQASRDGIIITDTRTWQIRFANDAACQLLGYAQGELVGKSVAHIHPPGELPAVREQYERQSRGEQAYAMELPCLRKDGAVIYCDISATPVAIDEQPCLLGFLRDVTERKATAKIREDIDLILRHDLKGPLNGIINLPEIMLQDTHLSPDFKESLQAIADSGRKMLDRINRSLDLYRMETGAYEYQPNAMDLARVFKRLLVDVRPLAAEHGVWVTAAINGAPPEQATPALARGEELLTYSMISNLLANAVEASPMGGTVTLTATTTDALVYKVHNLGAVPRVIQSRFFDKFATYGKRHGTGLGTYSARLMAETMGGDIACTTSDTEGTTVTVTLPLA